MNFKKISVQSEKFIAKKVQGHVQPGSGSKWYKKADVESTKFIIQDKVTMSSSYSLSTTDLTKLTQLETKYQKIPVFTIMLCNRYRVCLLKKHDICIDELECILTKHVKSSFNITLSLVKTLISKNAYALIIINSVEYVLVDWVIFEQSVQEI